MAKIKNIILDLGGVIINLDIPKTIKAFESIGFENFAHNYTQMQQMPFFDEYDKGKISSEEFIEEVKKLHPSQVNNSQIIWAWNEMLLDFPIHRIEYVKKLSQQYRVFLLSNTNELHIEAFEKILHQPHQLTNLSSLFEKDYYSCRIGMRKPDTEIFEFVLEQNNLNKNETVFIDDSKQHVEGANKIGLDAHLISQQEDISVFLEKILSLA